MGNESVRELTESDVAAFLGDLLPDRRLAGLTSRSGGGVTDVYEAEFDDGSEPLVVKAYSELSRLNRAKEVHVYGLFADRAVAPIPTIVHSSESSPFLHGRAHTVMTRLPGEPVQSFTDAMTSAERFAVYREMGAVIASVHRISLPAYGYITTAIRNPVATNVERMTSLWDAKLTEFDGYSGDPVLGTAIRGYVVVLETLAPAERLAFVLHDLFAVPFEEIGEIVGRSPAATRQLASRARRRVQGADPDAAPPADVSGQREVVQAFLAASRGGDFEALLAVLDPDVVVRADAAGVQMGAAALVRGRDEVVGTFAGRAKAAQLALVDGVPGMVWTHKGTPRVVFEFTVRDGRIVAIDMFADSKAISEIEVALLPE